MIQIEEAVVKQALEALESVAGVGDIVRWHKQFEYFGPAIAALTAAFQERSSVEQPAQGKSFYLNSEQPAQQFSCYCPNCEELTAQRDKLADILTRTANALKGQPTELTQHSWHDLPEVAQKLKAAQQEPLTDEQCDAIYYALDAWSREFDQHEFGLPATCGGGMEGGRAIIRAAIGIMSVPDGKGDA